MYSTRAKATSIPASLLRGETFFSLQQSTTLPFFNSYHNNSTRKTKPGNIQTKLEVGPADDTYERQADQVADAIVSEKNIQAQAPAGLLAPAPVQAKCAACDDERLQRKPNTETMSAGSVNTAVSNLGTGQALSHSQRAFFEPRFGQDFSDVRLHRDSNANASAASINAKAFTYGNHIAFANNAFSESTEGKKLLAHELTHVVQQKHNSLLPIQRTVSSASRCPGSVNGAPPAPEIFLTLTETLTSSALTLAMIGLTFDIQDLQAGRRPQNSNSFNAYLARFGPPEQLSNGRFRDRFSGSTSVSEDATIIAELTTLKNRLQQIQNFFSNNIIYRCTSATARITVGTCTDRCRADDGDAFAWTCSSGAPRTIVICPEFWVMGASDASIGLIHEAAHLIFGFGDPAGSSMTTRRRARNPVCYSGFVASVSGRNPPDPDCPVVTAATTPPVAPVAPPTTTPTP